MEFAGEYLVERIHNIQQDIREFVFVFSHVCRFHILYDYVSLKIANVFSRSTSLWDSCDLRTSSRPFTQPIWDLRHIRRVLDTPDNNVVFRSFLPPNLKDGQETQRKPHPINSTSFAKIARLEEEVESLKRKLAAILSKQASPVGGKLTTAQLLTGSVPPPPPPLPPLISLSNPIDSIKQQIQKNKSYSLNAPERSVTEMPLMSLGDIMKSAQSVKLRHVDRSPGGTPLRRPPLSAASDLHSVLTQAMKRRFDLIYPEESPQKNSGNGSWSPSPVRNNTRRKSSRQSLSPLQEITC